MPQRQYDQNGYVHGQWNALCDRCGFKFKSGDLKKEWQGLYVCKDCWEIRQPLDFLEGVPDDPSVPWTRPDSNADTNTTDISGNSITTENAIDTVGDTDKTLTVGDHTMQVWSTTLTANRTVTLDTTGAITGDSFTVQRTAGGAFTLDVGGLKTVPASVQAIVVVRFNGAAWQLERYTTTTL